MTTADYLGQLQQDREDLVDNLEAKGITGLTGDETFTELVPEVLNIQSGTDLSEYFETQIKFPSSVSEFPLVDFVKKFPDVTYVSANGTGYGLESMFNQWPLSVVPKVIMTNNSPTVTKMNSMFSNCSNLKQVDVSGLITNNVTTMANMFSGSKELTSIDLSSFNTSNVTDMSYMFANCDKLTSLTLGNNFNTSNVTNMGYMFRNCKAMTTLDLSNFNTGKVTNMEYMFNGCASLTTLDIRNFDFTTVSNSVVMFLSVPSGCLIIVKDQTAKDWVLNKRSDFTNVKTVAEYEASLNT